MTLVTCTCAPPTWPTMLPQKFSADTICSPPPPDADELDELDVPPQAATASSAAAAASHARHPHLVRTTCLDLTLRYAQSACACREHNIRPCDMRKSLAAPVDSIRATPQPRHRCRQVGHRGRGPTRLGSGRAPRGVAQADPDRRLLDRVPGHAAPC